MYINVNKFNSYFLINRIQHPQKWTATVILNGNKEWHAVGVAEQQDKGTVTSA